MPPQDSFQSLLLVTTDHCQKRWLLGGTLEDISEMETFAELLIDSGVRKLVNLHDKKRG